MSNRYALLLDNLYPTDLSKIVLEEIYKHMNIDITIFLLNKHNVVPSPLPVFSIADYFNFKGITIVTSEQTMEKVKAYPVAGLSVVISDHKVPGFINIEEFNLDLIEKTVNEYNAQHQANVS